MRPRVTRLRHWNAATAHTRTWWNNQLVSLEIYSAAQALKNVCSYDIEGPLLSYEGFFNCDFAASREFDVYRLDPTRPSPSANLVALIGLSSGSTHGRGSQKRVLGACVYSRGNQPTLHSYCDHWILHAFSPLSAVTSAFVTTLDIVVSCFAA